MTPEPRFLKQPKSFWANVRTISQHLGYTVKVKRRKGQTEKATGPVKVPTVDQMAVAMIELGLNSDHIKSKGQPTELGRMLHEYFSFRANAINNIVKPQLMSKEEAEATFKKLHSKLCPTCPLPMNKQKGAKKNYAFLTGIVNMLIEANLNGLQCDYDPRELTTVTAGGMPLRTLARRVDGAFPGPVNPIAIWEIKEYYYTTTFGSRVADGVYESLLDGLELEELRDSENIDVKHYLIVDDYYTWWDCGRSYLCRIIDMLQMGYVDEVLFGSEVVDRLPKIVAEWVQRQKRRGDS